MCRSFSCQIVTNFQWTKTELWKLDVTLKLEDLYCPLKHVFCSWCEQAFTGALWRVFFFVHHNNQVPRPVGLMHSNERLVFIYDLLHKHHQCSPECHVMKPMKGQGLFKWHFDGICLPPLTFRWVSFLYFD